jgi:hypothetical protein
MIGAEGEAIFTLRTSIGGPLEQPGLGQSGLDVLVDRANERTDRAERHDRHDRDERRQKRVLDHVLSIVFPKEVNERIHRGSLSSGFCCRRVRAVLSDKRRAFRIIGFAAALLLSDV